MILALAAIAAGAPILSAHAADGVVEIGSAAPESAAPESAAPTWDARGLGPLPWQGVACLDMSDDGRSVVVGTIAPQGDSNLMTLDGNGKVVGQHIAGQRWVNEVFVSGNGRFVGGLSTTPEGTSGDVPRLYGFIDGRESNQIGDAAVFRFADFRPEWCLWHYGEHSNHLPHITCRAGNRVVVAGDQSVYWLEPGGKPAVEQARIGPGLTTAMAASADGVVAVGRYPVGFYYTPREAAEHSDELAAISPQSNQKSAPAFRDLVVVKPNEQHPVVWSRPLAADAAPSPPPEEGIYGPSVPPHTDVKFKAPLAVAIDRRGKRIAVADYEGRQRVFHPRDGSRDIPFGTRFTPSHPTVHVYDMQGRTIRRLGPESFPEAFWIDLAFSPDGQTLVLSPHNWTSRGLAGQPILPADEHARTLYLCRLDNGDTRAVRFPDAVASVDFSGGTIAVCCWNHKLYLLDQAGNSNGDWSQGIDVGSTALVRGSKIGPPRFCVATTAGIVSMFDERGQRIWRTDLDQAVRHGNKPWTKNQKADQIAPGIWRANTGRAQSDLGNQYVIEAPRGLILIDPNAGESFEQNWARIAGAGLDPMRVRYVLITHEHGDHAPGARLWRVITGAQTVAGATTAYDLQHLTPAGTGYGFHPPTPVDIPISQDKQLDLAGLKVTAICLPGHTYGSMGYVFEKNRRTYAATGDLIMGGGVLGYDGSLDFNAEDVLRSLRKVQWTRPDMVLGGHGTGSADDFIARGIEAGEETGWSHMTPPAPNPFCRFTQKNYLITAWREPIVAAAYGDLDGDGRPDVAVLTPRGRGSVVKIYLNRGGKFAEQPDVAVDLPDLERGCKLRIMHFGKGPAADLFAASEEHALLLLSQPATPEAKLRYKLVPLPVTRAVEATVDDFPTRGRPGLLIGARFLDAIYTAEPLPLPKPRASERQSTDGVFRVRQTNHAIAPYLNCQFGKLLGDTGDDLITSNGDIFLHRPDGTMADVPAVHLTPPPSESERWTWVGVGDFEKIGRPDVALLANSPAGATVWLYRNTRNPQAPFSSQPTAKFLVPGAEVNRDGPTVADWNGDGAADLILCKRGNDGGAFILTGSPTDGLSPTRIDSINLDYVPYYDCRFGVADFAGNGTLGLAGFGRSPTGTMGVYIWMKK